MDWKTKKGLLLDLDGTLFRGKTVMPGAKAWISSIIQESIPFLYWTNNSTRTPQAVAHHLQDLGFPAESSDVYTSSMALSDVLMENHPDRCGDAVYVVGEEGLQAALAKDFTVFCRDKAPSSPFAVAVGLDRQVSYDHLRHAVRFILQGAKFYATNPDRLLWENDGLSPGAGSLVALVAFATGVTPIIVGKPEASFVHIACKKLGIDACDALVIGDNPLTDIAAGKRAGASTILIASELQQDGSEETKADQVITSLMDLLP